MPALAAPKSCAQKFNNIFAVIPLGKEGYGEPCDVTSLSLTETSTFPPQLTASGLCYYYEAQKETQTG